MSRMVLNAFRVDVRSFLSLNSCTLYLIVIIYNQGILWICDGRGHQNGPMAPFLIKCI